jgi:hypothetical protein
VAAIGSGQRGGGRPQGMSEQWPVALQSPAMTSREERLARNEARSREINEALEFGPAAAAVRDRFMRMVCECGNPSCDLPIAITVLEYERVRSDPVRFAVVRDHVIGDIEVVVEENDRFVVVAKREGEPATVATEEDPRS